MTRAQSEKDRE